MLEAYTALGALATATEKVLLGTLVTGNTRDRDHERLAFGVGRGSDAGQQRHGRDGPLGHGHGRQKPGRGDGRAARLIGRRLRPAALTR